MGFLRRGNILIAEKTDEERERDRLHAQVVEQRAASDAVFAGRRQVSEARAAAIRETSERDAAEREERQRRLQEGETRRQQERLAERGRLRDGVEIATRVVQQLQAPPDLSSFEAAQDSAHRAAMLLGAERVLREAKAALDEHERGDRVF